MARLPWDQSRTPSEHIRSLNRDSLPEVMAETQLREFYPWGFMQMQLHFFIYVSSNSVPGHQTKHAVPNFYAQRTKTVEALYNQARLTSSGLVHVNDFRELHGTLEVYFL
ncbi:hypothetical protein QCA50_012378 [Cerrena zonata]|uniref:Uncharacterized protein n=1 Tax=Cerrena zonata TaxID=2478898 RepID=A0AAW0FUA3_9APHY